MNDKREPLVRLFTGIPLSDSAREHVASTADGVSGELTGVRWVAEGNWHVTLKFLGPCEQSCLDGICSMMLKAAPFLPFRLEIGGIGAFPSNRSARVIWVGAGDIDGRAREVHRVLDRAAVRYGIAREKRRYSPHVTVGRARNKPVLIPVEMVERYHDTITMDVDHVLLFKSELTRSGAVYSVVEKVGG